MLPSWVNATVVLSLVGLFGYNIVIVGTKGYPTSVLIAGLIGAYGGLNQILKSKSKDGDEK